MYQFIFSNVSNAGIFITILFLPIHCQSHICNFFYFTSCSFKINRNSSSVRYLQSTKLSQLTVVKKSKTRNLGRSTYDVVIFQ